MDKKQREELQYFFDSLDYRKSQLSKVYGKDLEYSEYKPKIKIIKPCGETKWLDITEKELGQIVDVLTKAVEVKKV